MPSQLVAEQRAAWCDQLLAYLNSALPPWDWRWADHLATRVWDRVVERGAVDLTAGADEASGLPAYLAAAARAVLREHLHPAPGVTPEPVPSRRNPYPATAATAVRLAVWERRLLVDHAVVDGLPAAA
ncbi:hypothetical protein [Streptomyces triticirhizae]|uniref:hypothetical protein n=1 Tax=Streptomyces triticirhizae TaxID=2483353 RepID=UPI0011C36F26|nr:hypothetical protein [Streptomyces triticirhizae]